MRTVQRWVEVLLAVGIPSGAINSVAQILDDPHINARGLVQEGTLPDGDTWRYVGAPVGFSATPAQMRLPPPKLGQHTDEILRDTLGMDEATIQAYRERGIV
jgi:succinate--hydroxymethylglutarate CoA-transferase